MSIGVVARSRRVRGAGLWAPRLRGCLVVGPELAAASSAESLATLVDFVFVTGAAVCTTLQSTVAMLSAKTGILAENVFVDRDSGETIICNLIDDFAAAAFPASVRQLVFLALIQREAQDPAEHESSFTVAVNGSQVVTQRQLLKFQGSSTSTRALFRMRGLNFPAPGEVTFRLSVADRTVSEYLLKVAKLPS